MKRDFTENATYDEVLRKTREELDEQERAAGAGDTAGAGAGGADPGGAGAATGESENTTPPYSLIAVTVAELLAREFPPRENLLDPWLPTQGLTMLYGQRGLGKTHAALGIAYAVASGGKFLRWQAPRASGVLFLDGEMPAVVVQERLAHIVAASGQEPSAPLLIVNPDLQPQGMPDLSSSAGQAAVEALLTDEIKLIVVDNISTLTAGGKENEAESWVPVQAWALRQRAKGRSVLFIHHAGKGGQQRGTSKREDVLDTVIALRRPSDYSPEQGAVFEVHFEKARGIHGADVEPFEARLGEDAQGRHVWTTRTVEESTFERVVELLNEGLSQNEIAVELEINKSNVSRHAKRARAEGKVTTPEKAKRQPAKADRRAGDDD